MPKHSRTKVRLVAALLVIGLLVGGAYWWFSDAASPDAHQPQVTGQTETTHSPHEAATDPSRPQEQQSEPTDEPDSDSAPPPEPQPLPPVPLEVTFLDESSNSVSRTRLHYAILDPRDIQQIRARVSEQAGEEAVINSLLIESAVTDDNGVWKLGAKPGRLVCVMIPGRTISGYRQYGPAPFKSPAVGYVHAGRSLRVDINELVRKGQPIPTESFTLIASSRDELSASIIFDDGTPYEGLVSWTSGSGIGRQSAKLVSDGTPFLIPVRGTDPIRVSVSRVARDGYASGCTWDVDSADILQGIARLVIPQDPERRLRAGTLTVDMRSLPDGSVVTVTLMTLSGTGLGRMTIDYPTLVPFGEILSSGVYVVVTGDFAWRSELVSLPPGEHRTIVPDLDLPSTVTVRLVDAQGRPLSDGILRACDGTGNRRGWATRAGSASVSRRDGSDRRAAHRQAMEAPTGPDGIAVLRGTAPGPQTFSVEAKGYEYRVLEVTVQPDSETDIGDVVLTPASGRVTVRLESSTRDTFSDLVLSIYPVDTGSAYVYRQVVPEDGLWSIEGFPGGEFSVLISPASGGMGHARPFELSIGESVEVTVDMDRPPGVQRD
jgi:hypothetical protein